MDPVGREGAFFEAGDGFDIVAAAADGEGLNARPPGVAEALDAGLGGSEEFHGREVTGAEVEGFEALLGEHEGHRFGVGDGGVAGDDDVDSGSDEAAGVAFEDSGGEGSAGLVEDVLAGELDDETHAGLAGGEGGVGLGFHEGLEPVREMEADVVGERHGDQ